MIKSTVITNDILYKVPLLSVTLTDKKQCVLFAYSTVATSLVVCIQYTYNNLQRYMIYSTFTISDSAISYTILVIITVICSTVSIIDSGMIHTVLLHFC